MSGLIPTVNALWSTVAFVLVSNPEAYKLSESLLGSHFTVASVTGAPTWGGVALHAFFFLIFIWIFQKMTWISRDKRA